MTPTIDAPTRTSQTSSAVSAPVEVLEWVHEAAAWLTPREVVWCDGSPAEAQRLSATLVESGTFTPLNPEKRPGRFLARSEPSDVARVESRTFVCTADPHDAGPTNNWVDPQEMKDTLREVARGSMAGRTLYVVPFSMGPLDSPLSRRGVQITDSAYVALSLHTMVRVMRGGEEVKISKRAGSYVTLRDLIEWTSKDAVRFFLLSRKPDTEYVFDVDLAIAKNNDNPVYYVQYAHARICSVLATWGGDVSSLQGVALDALEGQQAQALLMQLSKYPAMLADAAVLAACASHWRKRGAINFMNKRYRVGHNPMVRHPPNFLGRRLGWK